MLLYQYILHYGLLLHIISQYLCLFSLILQGLHEEGECRQLEFLAAKGANIRDLFCTAPEVLKLHRSQFWNILKILGEESTRGGPPTVHKGGGCALPPWARPLPRGRTVALLHLFFHPYTSSSSHKHEQPAQTWVQAHLAAIFDLLAQSSIHKTALGDCSLVCDSSNGPVDCTWKVDTY